MKVPISAIKGLDVYRKDLGDIQGLAVSIKKSGLLNPVILSKDDRLISGARRIAAAIYNGSTVIDAVAVEDIPEAIRALEAEKDNGSDIAALPLKLSEMARQGEVIASLHKRNSHSHQGFLLRDKLSTYYNRSRATLRRALLVVRAADASEGSGDAKRLCDQMDSDGVVGTTLRALTGVARSKNKALAAANLGSGSKVPCIDSLTEQRAALMGAGVKLEGLIAILPRIQEINPRMPQEEIADIIHRLSAGRTVLTQTLATLRKAQTQNDD